MIVALLCAMVLPSEIPNVLHYSRPAEAWTEALPVGNGHLGAMVFGKIDRERLQLNESTLWSGGPGGWDRPGAKEALPALREALFARRFSELDGLAQKLQGPFTEAYQPMSDLWIDLGHDEVESYRRELDLNTGMAKTTYRAAGTLFTREVFASYPDGVLVVRLSAERPGALNATFSLSSEHVHSVQVAGGDTLLLGRLPMRSVPNYLQSENPIEYSEGGIRFCTALRLRVKGGTTEGGTITGADEIVALVSAGSSFAGFDRDPSEGPDPASLAIERLDAVQADFEALRARHVADHAALFGRVELVLGDPTTREKPTDERLAEFAQTQDPDLAALAFQFGRYLLIACSRPGAQPANLQGMWNQEVRPPWSSNYTININTQMNYWPVHTANLGELHEPLHRMVSELSVTGARSAQAYYGTRGWTAHHNSDLWRHSSPVGDLAGWPGWANWPMGGPWLASQLMEHYRFSGDLEYLRQLWPILQGSALFALDWLVEDRRPDAPSDQDGRPYLVTAPSTSPEIDYVAPDGARVATGIGATMDLAILRELFDAVVEAGSVLGAEPELLAEVKAARERLLPYQVGMRGQLQEWADDYPETDPQHRHLSHLFGAFPGSTITLDTTPDLAAAVRKSLDIRGDESTGWAMAWRMCLWARLRDPERAYGMVLRQLKTVPGQGGVYPNLFGSHPPFQIDSNFGYTAGVAEMLLQSHEGALRLLPCLPKAWHTGSVRGLRARGGHTVDMRWSDGKLEEATITPGADGTLRVIIDETLLELEAKKGEPMSVKTSR